MKNMPMQNISYHFLDIFNCYVALVMPYLYADIAIEIHLNWLEV